MHTLCFIQFLIDNYPKLEYNISPSPNVSAPIQIYIQLALYSIIQLVGTPCYFFSSLLMFNIYSFVFHQNGKEQTLTTNCEKIFSWNDMFLRQIDIYLSKMFWDITLEILFTRWNPLDYDNITQTTLPYKQVNFSIKSWDRCIIRTLTDLATRRCSV